MKVDGRKLRKDINKFVRENYTDKQPVFTIRSIERKRGYKSTLHILDVRFDELDQDALDVWYDVAEWVSDVWWPQNKRYAKMSVKMWQGLYRGQQNKPVQIDGIEVGYGFTH